VHPNFFAALLHLHPDLTPTDLKHCALIRLGLSNKEKAQILNLSYKGIDSANYRIKKKLGLGMDDNLANYLMHVGAAEARS
jgi:DNA-binding CsgD family transcriptional regulator